MIARIVSRALLLCFAFLVAAGLALAVLFFLGGIWAGQELRAAYPHDPMMHQGADFFGIVLFTATVTPALTVLPALVAAIVGEVLRLRSWMYYVVMGGLALVAVPLVVATPDQMSSLPSAQVTAIFAAAGFAGGFVYWLLAGRNA